MTRRNALLWLLAALLFANLTITSGIAEKKVPVKTDYYDQISLFAGALSIVQADYVEEMEPKKLIHGALDGMLSSLDSHSQFLDEEAYKEIRVETKGEFGGLGIEIGVRDGLLTIISPIEGTPAYKAGLMAQDRIVKIDGESTRDIRLHEAVKKLRGKPGTDIQITVLREKEKKLLDFKITRGIIKIDSIKKAEIIDEEDKIGYIRLVEFQENTPKDLNEALEKLTRDGMQAFILDLRNNPGGLLNISVDVSEAFLEKGAAIVSTKGRAKGQGHEYKAAKDGKFRDFPMVVLVNGGSASASEIVAGAIQDNKRGIILGTKSFGKGSVQTVIPLKDDTALRLTTARYYTPSGRQIHEAGIDPDIIVEPKTLEAKDEPKEEDIFKKLKDMEKEKETGPPAEGAEESDEAAAPDEEPQEPEKYDNQLESAKDLLKGIRIYKSFMTKHAKK